MQVIYKTQDDIAKIKQACNIWKQTCLYLKSFIKPGASLNELNDLAKNKIIELGGYPTFYKQYGFPKHICISVNDCVVHGVPNDYILQDNDIVTLDIGVTYENHICDAAFTVVLGFNPSANNINKVCKDSLELAIQQIVPNKTTNMDLARFIYDYVTKNGYYVLEDFSGHGCGNYLHEPPGIPNYYDPSFPVETLKPNMVICIEPMIMTDSNAYFIAKNDWNVMAKNKKLTCHWEHMVLITETGYEILTQMEN